MEILRILNQEHLRSERTEAHAAGGGLANEKSSIRRI